MCNALGGSYGFHPLDKYDRQAQEPRFAGRCSLCWEPLQLGAEIWVYRDITLCCQACRMIYADSTEGVLDYDFELIVNEEEW